VLTTRLRELCAAGLATREVSDGPPTRVDYLLTPAGRDLRTVLKAVERYGSKHHELLERFDAR
jgi:DNA-binding HxlR family transcriptional regulator